MPRKTYYHALAVSALKLHSHYAVPDVPDSAWRPPIDRCKQKIEIEPPDERRNATCSGFNLTPHYEVAAVLGFGDLGVRQISRSNTLVSSYHLFTDA
jgi:hypothetical protein